MILCPLRRRQRVVQGPRDQQNHHPVTVSPQPGIPQAISKKTTKLCSASGTLNNHHSDPKELTPKWSPQWSPSSHGQPLENMHRHGRNACPPRGCPFSVFCWGQQDKHINTKRKKRKPTNNNTCSKMRPNRDPKWAAESTQNL